VILEGSLFPTLPILPIGRLFRDTTFNAEAAEAAEIA
jgi:hypothetical protein